ncbi:epimerase [Streptomyces sp. GMY02]|uniref:epimerase n=1 Tax=Streptomyces sp. GMY02 TaxID=1333528 RepID=UPI001C2C0756|nr:epimerase [Streptomyces sp. GMY02]QXE34704.1 epimerase [Streptomyces sp. GMY02]
MHDDFTDFSAIEDELAGADACFYCLGVSSAGRGEAEYTRITYDYTLAAARSLVRVSPGLVFIYVSGEGTDSEQRARAAWARIKGRTENDLAALNLRAHMFRPGYIQPRHGARSRTPLYRLLYAATSWLYPVLHKLAPAHTTTTDHLAQAMLTVARTSADSPRILTTPQINTLATKTPPLPH